MKTLFFFVLIMTFGASSAFAQIKDKNAQVKDKNRASSARPVKTISGGVVNGKALKLGKPEYPAAAKAVRAEGIVTVQVLIDENGDVETATAASGHPLLRAAAVRASKESKFEPALFEGVPVKVSGIITYNFVGDINWLQVAYNLTLTESSESLTQFLRIGAIEAKIPRDWAVEKNLAKDLLMKLTATLSEPEKLNPDRTLPRSLFKPVNHNRTAAELKTKLRERLGSTDELSNWYFSLGEALANPQAEGGDAEIQEFLSKISVYEQTAPQGAASSVTDKLKSLAAFAAKGSFDSEDKSNIKSLIKQITGASF